MGFPRCSGGPYFPERSRAGNWLTAWRANPKGELVEITRSWLPSIGLTHGTFAVGRIESKVLVTVIRVRLVSPRVGQTGSEADGHLNGGRFGTGAPSGGSFFERAVVEELGVDIAIGEFDERGRAIGVGALRLAEGVGRVAHVETKAEVGGWIAPTVYNGRDVD